MALPVSYPVEPMLATAVPDIPDHGDLLFEPKFDGFRCLVFKDGADVILQSRSSKSLNRYFPEIVAELARALPERIVLDGELIVDRNGRLDFDALSERIHPAASRVRLLAEQTPARYVAFDLLAVGEQDLTGQPGRDRRDLLTATVTPTDSLHLAPVTTDPDTARTWFTLFEGAGLDGVIGKPANGPYTPGKRTMLKFKHARTADCVVAGLRWYKDTEPGTSVGSLLLGLYDDDGVLHHVGVVGSFPAVRRKQLAAELAPLAEGGELDHPWLGGERAGERTDEHRERSSQAPSAARARREATGAQRLPGSINRWRSEMQEWLPLRTERVVEVGYEHTEGGHPSRFRHTARFVRWRPDREPESCRYDQLDEPARYDLAAVLRGEVRSSEG